MFPPGNIRSSLSKGFLYVHLLYRGFFSFTIRSHRNFSLFFGSYFRWLQAHFQGVAHTKGADARNPSATSLFSSGSPSPRNPHSLLCPVKRDEKIELMACKKQIGAYITRQTFLRRDGRVVEDAALEMLCRGNLTVGSNPTLSANFFLSRKTRQKVNNFLSSLKAVESEGFADSVPTGLFVSESNSNASEGCFSVISSEF